MDYRMVLFIIAIGLVFFYGNGVDEHWKDRVPDEQEKKGIAVFCSRPYIQSLS